MADMIPYVKTTDSSSVEIVAAVRTQSSVDAVFRDAGIASDSMSKSLRRTVPKRKGR